MIDIDALENEIIPETRATYAFLRSLLDAEETLPWEKKLRAGRAWYLVGQQGFFLHVPGRRIAELLDVVLACAPCMCDVIARQTDTIQSLITTIREQMETIREMHAHARDRPDCHRL